MKFTLPKDNQSGLTLVEILISMVISIFMLIVIFLGMQQTRYAYQRTSNTLYQARNARKAFDRIVSEIQYADPSSIVISTDGSIAYQSSLNTDTQYAIYVADHQIYLQNVTDSTIETLTAIDVNSFAVTDLTNNIYHIELTYADNQVYETSVHPLN